MIFISFYLYSLRQFNYVLVSVKLLLHVRKVMCHALQCSGLKLHFVLCLHARTCWQHKRSEAKCIIQIPRSAQACICKETTHICHYLKYIFYVYVHKYLLVQNIPQQLQKYTQKKKKLSIWNIYISTHFERPYQREWRSIHFNYANINIDSWRKNTFHNIETNKIK